MNSPIFHQTLLALIAAHVLGDFVLQSDHIARNKRQFAVLLRHAGVLAGLSYLICTAWRAWWIPVLVFVAHAAVDAVKSRVENERLLPLAIDQLAHLATLVPIAWLSARQGAEVQGVVVFGDFYQGALVVVAGAGVAVFAGGVVVGIAVRPLLAQLEQVEGEPPAPSSARGFENGGRLIGQLERALIFLFVLGGQAGSIGFLIAAKSVLRFGEVKEPDQRMEAEYIIIGTLMSFAIGLLSAFATSWLLTRL